MLSYISLDILIKIGITLGIILFAKIFGSLISFIIIKMFNFKEKNKENIKQNPFYKPIKLFIFIIGIYSSTLLFNIPQNIKLIIFKIFKICIVLIAAKGFSNLFNTNSYIFKNIQKKLNTNKSNSMIKIISNVLKIFVYIVAGFIVITELGYDLGGLVTGLGISSVVIALAAQDVAKSLLGGLCIFLDKPFEIGDYIKVNNYEGTVEEISFRSTRIRNVAKELIVVPNSEIASDYIINYSRRDSRRYTLNLVLELSTPLEKISSFKEQLLQILKSHNNVIDENIRIYFGTISDNGYDFNIGFYTDIMDYNDFLKFKENMNFEIMNLLQKEKIELAYDSKTIYLKK